MMAMPLAGVKRTHHDVGPFLGDPISVFVFHFFSDTSLKCADYVQSLSFSRISRFLLGLRWFSGKKGFLERMGKLVTP